MHELSQIRLARQRCSDRICEAAQIENKDLFGS
jgi:hypothetical protein